MISLPSYWWCACPSILQDNILTKAFIADSKHDDLNDPSWTGDRGDGSNTMISVKVMFHLHKTGCSNVLDRSWFSSPSWRDLNAKSRSVRRLVRDPGRECRTDCCATALHHQLCSDPRDDNTWLSPLRENYFAFQHTKTIWQSMKEPKQTM